jgi:hypothetical protein
MLTPHKNKERNNNRSLLSSFLSLLNSLRANYKVSKKSKRKK